MKKILAILLIGIICCKSQPLEELESKSIELSQLQEGVDSLYQSEIGVNEPGAALMVSHEGEMIIGKGYGLRDVEGNKPITPSTNMRMASVSKQFTALCILTLVDQYNLKLSDQAHKYLPYPIFEGISVEQLINHTSGLPDYYEHFDKNWDRDNILENYEVLEWLATSPDRAFNPGEKWEYSNTAYLMLALIVEKVSGVEFSEFAKANIFKKAGMTNTQYFNLAKPADILERAFCYEIDSLGESKQVDGFFMNGVMGDGAVYTSLNDYFQYDLALRNKEILSEATHRIIFEPSSTQMRNEEERHYGMGWGVTDSTASHTGGWFGTNTFVKRYLNTPLTIAIFMNRNTLFRNNLVEKTDSIVMDYVKAIRSSE
jgi:CubicO group peptidase (beta-lactamase class C family)